MKPSPEATILVIEDEPEIRKFLKVILTSHDFRFTFAETAKEGIKLVSSMCAHGARCQFSFYQRVDRRKIR